MRTIYEKAGQAKGRTHKCSPLDSTILFLPGVFPLLLKRIGHGPFLMTDNINQVVLVQIIHQV